MDAEKDGAGRAAIARDLSDEGAAAKEATTPDSPNNADEKIAQPASQEPDPEITRVTILRCTGRGKRATKRWHRTADGGVDCEDFNAGTFFKVHLREVSDIRSLAELLHRIETCERAFVIRGEPIPGVDLSKRVRRLKHERDGAKPTFRDREGGLPWVMLDVDKVAIPDDIDLAADPEAAIRHLIGTLPPYFHDVTCYWQLSSSAGMMDGVLSAHLWYWFGRNLADAELDAWAAQTGAPVDAALFRTVQPHFCAAPIFDGVDDPLPRRRGLLEGARDAVEFPEIEVPEAPAAKAEAVEEEIPEGRRGAALTYLAGSMRWRGMTAEEIEASLIVINRNRCNPPLPNEKVSGIAQSIARYKPAERVAPSRPRIVHNGRQLRDVSREAWGALLKANAEAPMLFRFGSNIARVESDDHGLPRSRTMIRDEVVHELSEAADWYRINESKKLVATAPPPRVATDLLATPRADNPLPELRRMCPAPVIARDGSVRTVRGYDPQTGLYFAFCA